MRSRIGKTVSVSNEAIGVVLDERPMTDGGTSLSSGITIKHAADGPAPLIGQPGSFVDVSVPSGSLLCMVTGVRLTSAYGAANGAANGGSADDDPIFRAGRRMLDTLPVGLINRDGVFERGADALPTVGAEVFTVAPETLRKIYSKSVQSLAVGKLSILKQQDVGIDLDGFLSRHAAILGQTGAGKSWTVASLLQKMIRLPQASIVVLDLHGEYHRAFGDAATYLSPPELELPYWLMNAEELIDVCLDKHEDSAPVQIAKFKELLQEAKEAHKENQALRLPKITIDTPVYFDFQTMIRELERLDAELVLVNLVRTHGPFYGMFTRPLIRLRSRLNDRRFDLIFNPKAYTTTASMETLVRKILGEESKPKKLTVLDLSHVPFDVRSSAISLILRCLFDFAYWYKRTTGEPYPLAVVCDEAHTYLNDADPMHQPSRLAAERIAKEGRKYGISLTVISQRPREVSSTILSQCNSFVCLRISHPDDQQHVRSLLPDAMRGITSALSTLRQGEAIIVGDAIVMPTRVLIDPPDPKPDSRDVSFAGRWAKPHQPVDVAKVLEAWRKQQARGG